MLCVLFCLILVTTAISSQIHSTLQCCLNPDTAYCSQQNLFAPCSYCSLTAQWQLLKDTIESHGGFISSKIHPKVINEYRGIFASSFIPANTKLLVTTNKTQFSPHYVTTIFSHFKQKEIETLSRLQYVVVGLAFVRRWVPYTFETWLPLVPSYEDFQETFPFLWSMNDINRYFGNTSVRSIVLEQQLEVNQIEAVVSRTPGLNKRIHRKDLEWAYAICISRMLPGRWLIPIGADFVNHAPKHLMNIKKEYDVWEKKEVYYALRDIRKGMGFHGKLITHQSPNK